MRYDLLHPKSLRKAVIEHLGTEQDVPGERQFRRWVAGDTPVPGWARRVIDEVMGAQAQKEAAPPDWAERLLVVAEATRRKAGVTDAELAQAEADLVVLQHLGPNAGRRRKGVGGGDGGATLGG